VHLSDKLDRWRFESWIQSDIQNIASCVKSLFAQHNVNFSDVGSVFLTGGLFFRTVVRRFFSRTFGAGKIERWRGTDNRPPKDWHYAHWKRSSSVQVQSEVEKGNTTREWLVQQKVSDTTLL
jgi:hypothetical protein